MSVQTAIGAKAGNAGLKYVSMTIGVIEASSPRKTGFYEYLKEHDTGFIADPEDFPIKVDIVGNKAIIRYARIAEADAGEFIGLLSDTDDGDER